MIDDPFIHKQKTRREPNALEFSQQSFLSPHVLHPALVVRPVVVRIEFDVYRDSGRPGPGGVLAVEGGALENLVLEVGQSVGLPVFVVFFQGLPLDHALPFPMGLEEPEFFLERHVLQISNGWLLFRRGGGGQPGIVPLDPQGVAPQLELVVLAAPENAEFGTVLYSALHSSIEERGHA